MKGPEEKARITSVEFEQNQRKSSQIEYALSTGVVYRFNKKFHLHAEVMGKFYQFSIYENPSYANINPWSVEGRLGLVYYLN
jgi:hypothetical protein